MGADFELINKAAEQAKVQQITNNGRNSARQLSKFIDDYTHKRKKSYSYLKVQHVDINILIVDELHKYDDIRDKKGIKLRFKPYAGDLFYSDRRKIKVIVHTLIQNAIDFSDATRNEGVLDIKLAAEENGLRLIVQDNGIGITEENKSRIFKMFYSSKKNAVGSSLYAAKKAAEEAGGSLTIESTSGSGTIATAKLPNIT